MKDTWNNKRVMITGVSGTVGQELLAQLETMGVAEIVGIDSNENEIFFLEQKYAGKNKIRFYLTDIKDRETLEHHMRGCDIVLHAAALKHVGLCEHSPRSAVNTNILGVQNVIDAAVNTGVKRVLFTSSDKAVNPTNVMGTSKLMGERLFIAADTCREKEGPIFGVTRFGNVLGSRGSVIPVFRNQIMNGGHLTVRDADMTRFIMTLHDAVSLVLDAAMMFKGGEVFVTKMPVARIMDLAEVMIEELAPVYGRNPKDIRINVTTPLAGEKMYEELMNEEEVRHAVESDKFFIIMPALSGIRYGYQDMETEQAELPYTSANSPMMTKDELRAYLYEFDLLQDAVQAKTKLKVVK